MALEVASMVLFSRDIAGMAVAVSRARRGQDDPYLPTGLKEVHVYGVAGFQGGLCGQEVSFMLLMVSCGVGVGGWCLLASGEFSLL